VVKPPEPNELGWKETVRMNPLEDAIVAFRPSKPKNLPFKLPNSIRPLDPTMPLGSTLGFKDVDIFGNPVTVVNQLENFGWEYVWHCHLLGHEENIMMRPMAVAVTPKPASGLTATAVTGAVNLSWTDNSANETGFVLQRATAAAPTTWTTVTAVQSDQTTGPASPRPVTYADKSVARKTTYLYRIVATNVVGDTTTYPTPAAGYPHVNVDAAPTAAVSVTTG
jgi:hypothetical protein